MGSLLNVGRGLIEKKSKYLPFECPRMHEIIAYTYGDVVDMRGQEIANGTINGNDNTQVLSDYVYVDARQIPAHKDSDGNNVAAKAARVVSYKVELEVTSGAGSNVPWNLDSTTIETVDDAIFQIQETTGYTASGTKTANTTFANVLSDGDTGWGSQTVITQDGNKWVATFDARTDSEYLQVAVRAASGVTIKWSIIPLSTSTNACWQPVGITKTQCEAVTTFGNNNSSIQRFRGNALITKFNEFKYFTGMTVIWGNHSGGRYSGFTGCGKLSEITFPDTLTELGNDCFVSTAIKNFDFKNINTIGYCCFWNYSVVNAENVLCNKAMTIGNNNTAMFLYAKYIDIRDTMSACLYPRNGIVVLRSDTLINISFSPANTPKKIYVPAALLEDYKTTSPWSSQASKIYQIEGTWYETHRSLDPNES